VRVGGFAGCAGSGSDFASVFGGGASLEDGRAGSVVETVAVGVVVGGAGAWG
jgi:hypothetical protein